MVAACSSSTIAIGQAADAIRLGRLDAVVAGGTDALARLTYSGFNALRLMDPAPCRPFDRSRTGMNIGEGAGMLILESMDRARRRGAHIYGELAGYGLGCEAFHPTAPEPDGRPVADVIRRALADARINADADRSRQCAWRRRRRRTIAPNPEASARCSAIARRECRSRRLKAMIGHCLGAAGALEAAVMALTVARGVIPPTIHHTETDPECDVDVVANHAARRARAGRRVDVAGFRRQRLRADYCCGVEQSARRASRGCIFATINSEISSASWSSATGTSRASSG